MEIKYYKNLDGVRAIAALLVLVFHLFQNLDLEQKFASFINNMAIMGHFGVALFFVLSGFLITRILLASVKDPHFFKNFYVRRSLRIFPLYYLFLILWYFVYPISVGSPIAPMGEQIYFYTYLQSFPLTFNHKISGPGHFWSLAVEEHFYFFWPLVVYFLGKKNLLKVALFLIALSLILKWIFIKDGYDYVFFPLCRFDALAFGVLLALMELKAFFKKSNAWLFLIITLVFMVLTLCCNTNFVFDVKGQFEVFKYTFIAIVGFGIIGFLLCLPDENVLNKLMRTSFFSFSGKISYGLYVFHPLVLEIIAVHFPMRTWWLTGLLGIACVYLVSTLSYYFFEKPFLKLKKKFEYSK